MKRFAKILSIALSAVLLLGALSMSAGARAYDELTPWFFGELDKGETYTIQNTEKLLVVNDWIWARDRTGSFTIQTDASAPQNAQYAQDELTADEPQWSELQPDLPVMIGRDDESAAQSGEALYARSGTTRAVNDTLTLKGAINSGKRERDLDMVCLYVGTHCTVWGTTSDEEAVRLGSAQAAQIGGYFDEKFPTMEATFGGDFVDADGDGKVAIMCYDIDKNYKAGETFSGPYTAGFFDMKDMIGSDNKIGGVSFGESAAYPYNGIDCIRIDTYPVMGGTPDTLMTRVENCYSTLFHEFQHMLNFSSSLHHCEQRKTDKLYYMDTFLNEAFSMAAEHLVCGSDSTASRIRRFNGSDYKPGSPLTTWDGTLDNYANSYLFGQYLRTRYMQSGLGKETDGSDFYRTVYSRCSGSGYKGNAMDVVADLLQTNAISLTVDFWTAVCLNQSNGVFGFAGEDWADAIQMKTNDIRFGTSNDGISNSGAKLYQLDPKETYTITAATNCTLVAMSRLQPGVCGTDITWELAPDGALYIEGDGSAITSAPWRELPTGTRITSIHLPANLTSVPESAFAGLGTLDYVAFAGTVPEWQAIQFGSGNSAIANAPTKYFDSDFVRAYQYNANSKDVSLRLITDSQSVAFAAARFAANGRFLGYAYLAPNLKTNNDGEYGGSVHFSINGAKEFRVMAFTENGCPNDSARTFQLP
ncbi:MAG: hypothetical protein MSC56_08540 [Clostridiales bacterium]|nr:hypothetical protein [Clostridiales bacterium]